MALYPSLDTEVLRTFVAIAEQGGFTRAGEVVNRTQSAVSMQMKRLEEDVLQRQLFQRDGRTVNLTAEGQVLLGYARRILKLHSEVFNTLRDPHMVGAVKICEAVRDMALKETGGKKREENGQARKGGL